jgi:hypothetical protein
MVNTAVVRPATSWMSVLGGWIATIGAMALVAPAVAGVLVGANPSTTDVAAAIPVILGIFVSYLIGGYVAGRMAGYRTSWHGMLTAFFSLFVILVAVLVSYAAAQGMLSGISLDVSVVPGASGLNVDSLGNALTFGALLGFLAAILGGWLGGLLAPSQAVVPARAPYVAREAGPVPSRPTARDASEPITRREVVRERRPLLPAFGRKGGERVEERTVVEDRPRPDVDDI